MPLRNNSSAGLTPTKLIPLRKFEKILKKFPLFFAFYNTQEGGALTFPRVFNL